MNVCFHRLPCFMEHWDRSQRDMGKGRTDVVLTVVLKLLSRNLEFHLDDLNLSLSHPFLVYLR